MAAGPGLVFVHSRCAFGRGKRASAACCQLLWERGWRPGSHGFVLRPAYAGESAERASAMTERVPP